MRRLGRWLLNLLTMLSVLTCIAAAVLWARSYRVPVMFERTQSWPDPPHAEVFQWYSEYGGFLVSWSWQVSIDPPQSIRDALDAPIVSSWTPRQWNGTPVSGRPWWMRLGLG